MTKQRAGKSDILQRALKAKLEGETRAKEQELRERERRAEEDALRFRHDTVDNTIRLIRDERAKELEDPLLDNCAMPHHVAYVLVEQFPWINVKVMYTERGYTTKLYVEFVAREPTPPGEGEELWSIKNELAK